ncbi:recombinase family protein [Streptomyces sp. UNOC14_S4]|uniref:recombinase family protein n=1 Tax=Streptomyces sp. UNOC14_S4 TaxID=2872340 RepID=UPI001E35AF07|nr:recombinase family protein [Streptomyces sp. UNOC14_S4]MCC3766497.1 recombinase family protein [Streptomyces sp. UNOC14_S4]
MNEKKRVAVYTRGASSLGSQRAMCEKWAAKRGLKVVRTFESTSTQDQFPDLLNAISSGQFDVLVATEPRRYNLRATALKTLLETAKKHGVEVHAVEEPQLLAQSDALDALEELQIAETSEIMTRPRTPKEETFSIHLPDGRNVEVNLGEGPLSAEDVEEIMRQVTEHLLDRFEEGTEDNQ